MKVAAKWQPIETAPLHCRVLVAEARGYRSIARQEFDLKMKLFWIDDSGRNPNPTHWQPLPDPPPQFSSKMKKDELSASTYVSDVFLKDTEVVYVKDMKLFDRNMQQVGVLWRKRAE